LGQRPKIVPDSARRKRASDASPDTGPPFGGCPRTWTEDESPFSIERLPYLEHCLVAIVG